MPRLSVQAAEAVRVRLASPKGNLDWCGKWEWEEAEMNREERLHAQRTTLTDKQAAVLDFITAHIHRGLPPCVREIQAEFGIKSPNGVMCHLRALESKGFIKCGKRRARDIALCGNSAPEGWRPIETAPRDGTIIVAYRLVFRDVTYEESAVIKWHEGGWRTPREGFIAGDPQFWMPLPAPPTALPPSPLQSASAPVPNGQSQRPDEARPSVPPPHRVSDTPPRRGKADRDGGNGSAPHPTP